MFRWWGQLRAIWDNAGQLVELRGEIEAAKAEIEQLRGELQRLDERTRKQNYRERKQAEDAAWSQTTAAVPVGARSELVRAARARGLIR